MDRDHWITAALRDGVLGVVALRLDRGPIPGYVDLDSRAEAIAREANLRSSQHLDDEIRAFRDAYFHLLGPGEKEELLRVVQRHADPGFPAVAVAYPGLKTILNRPRPLSGGGASPLEASFAETFPEEATRSASEGERPVHRRRPRAWNREVDYDDKLDDSVVSGWTTA